MLFLHPDQPEQEITLDSAKRYNVCVNYGQIQLVFTQLEDKQSLQKPAYAQLAFYSQVGFAPF